MLNTPLPEQLTEIPPLGYYDSREIDLRNAVVHLHFSHGTSHWYIIEVSGDTMFGYFFDPDLGDGLGGEEGWFRFSLVELEALTEHGEEVVNDITWEPALFKDIFIPGKF